MLLLEYWPNKKVVTPCCLPACDISLNLWVAGEFQQCCRNGRLRLQLQVSQHKSQRCCFVCIFYKDGLNFGRIWVQSFFQCTFDLKKKKIVDVWIYFYFYFFLPPSSPENGSDHAGTVWHRVPGLRLRENHQGEHGQPGLWRLHQVWDTHMWIH